MQTAKDTELKNRKTLFSKAFFLKSVRSWDFVAKGFNHRKLNQNIIKFPTDIVSFGKSVQISYLNITAFDYPTEKVQLQLYLDAINNKLDVKMLTLEKNNDYEILMCHLRD